MSTASNHKKFKRKIRKVLYHVLSAINDFDYRSLRPVFLCIAVVLLLFGMTKLPTTETDNSTSLEASYGRNLASSIRTVSGHYSTVGHSADIIAVFLPEDLTADASSTELSGKALYSFYLTGEEISYLVEAATSIHTKGSSLYLDGLSYTWHKNRLPFGRVTKLTLASGEEVSHNAIYHVISTEEIFSLFHYMAYRSIGMLTAYPKNMYGTPLADYQEALLSEQGEHFNVGSALRLASGQPRNSEADYAVSVVTTQSGFNLISLIAAPSKTTVCIWALLFALSALLAYMFPRLRRIRVWFRIYLIRSKKRSTRTFHPFRKGVSSHRNRTFRRIG